MKTNTEYKNAALAALKGNWAKAVLATVVFLAVAYLAIGPYMYQSVQLQAFMRDHLPQPPSSGGVFAVMQQISTALYALSLDPEYLALQSKVNGSLCLYYLMLILVVFPLSVGFTNAFLRLLVQGDDGLTGNMYRISTKRYWHKVWGMLLMRIFIFLWSLLLFIPGIVKSFSYAMTPFILEENPDLSANEAIDHSRAMMRGHKFDLFWLYLSFIGWAFLAILTLGVGLLWLIPYMQTSLAAFYEDVKADYEVNGGLI